MKKVKMLTPILLLILWATGLGCSRSAECPAASAPTTSAPPVAQASPPASTAGLGAEPAASEPAASQPSAAIDEQAEKVLRGMSETLGRAKAFSVHAVTTTDEQVDSGRTAEVSQDVKVVVRRPDRLYMETKGDVRNATVWYAGGKLAVLDKEDNAYATQETPGTVEQMLDSIHEQYGLAMPLADLLFPDVYEVLAARVQTGTYVGEHEIDGKPCHQLLFTQENVDWQIWIDAGDVAVPRRLIITYKQEAGQPQFEATLDQWDLSASPPDSMFEPKPPEGAARVEMAAILEEQSNAETQKSQDQKEGQQ